MFTMKITIFAIGKIKEKYLKDGINEYLLRLKNGFALQLRLALVCYRAVYAIRLHA